MVPQPHHRGFMEGLAGFLCAGDFARHYGRLEYLPVLGYVVLLPVWKRCATRRQQCYALKSDGFSIFLANKIKPGSDGGPFKEMGPRLENYEASQAVGGPTKQHLGRGWGQEHEEGAAAK